MNLLNHILRIFVGLVFIISGLAKLYPIEPFEIIFVDLGISNWLLAPFIARFVIALELFLGICIVFNIWMKDVIYKITLTFLAIFMIYLIYLLILKGNNIDCGCFGSYFPMSPAESLIKNVVLVLLLLLIKRRYHNYGLLFKLVPVFFLGIAFSLPFLLNRVGLQNAQGIELDEIVDYSDLPSLYKTNEKIDFTQGSWVIAYLSVSCAHCESVAHKLSYLNAKNDIENLILVIGSKQEKNIQPFLDKTKLNYPIIWMNNDVFFKYSGGALPAFVYLENSVLKKKWTGEYFKVEEIEALIKN